MNLGTRELMKVLKNRRHPKRPKILTVPIIRFELRSQF